MERIKFKMAFIFFTGLLAACSSDRTSSNKSINVIPVNVQVCTPSSDNSGGLNFSGQVQAYQTANISTRMMGFIKQIYVKPGDKVQKGQLLVSILNEDIMANKAQAIAGISEAEAAFVNAERDYKRFTKLHELKSVSDKELENVTLQYKSIQSKLEMARQGLKEVDAMLAYTQIRAPFSGVITQKLVNEGSMTNPGMPLLIIEENGPLQVVATVAESDIAKLKVGDRAKITIKSIRKTVEGKIIELSPSSQATGGQFVLKLSMDNTSDLYPGMYANVFVKSEVECSNRPMIPTEALIERDQLSGVYVINPENKASLRWLRLGKKVGNYVEVLSGLSLNEKVVLKAEGKLYNGVSIVAEN